MDSNFLLVHTVRECSPDKRADIALELARNESRRITLAKAIDHLETIAVTGFTVFTLVILLNPGANYHTTQWFQSIQWLKVPQAIGAIQSPKATTNQPSQATGAAQTKLVRVAQAWVGESFKPGLTERCADFVRAVFHQAGVKLGITRQPADGLPTNAMLASSFFGTDQGKLIKNQNELRAGDLVAFAGTYGQWKGNPNVITHVGIYAGNGQIIDRPTANAPVKKRSLSTFTHFFAGLRPHAYETPGSERR